MEEGGTENSLAFPQLDKEKTTAAARNSYSQKTNLMEGKNTGDRHTRTVTQEAVSASQRGDFRRDPVSVRREKGESFTR